MHGSEYVCVLSTDKVDISNFQWWLLIFNYELPCRSKDRPPPIRQIIQVYEVTATAALFKDSYKAFHPQTSGANTTDGTHANAQGTVLVSEWIYIKRDSKLDMLHESGSRGCIER